MMTLQSAVRVALDLPRDFPPPVAPLYRRAQENLPLPAAAVVGFADRCGYEVSTICLTALGIARSRYADQSSLPLDIIVSKRTAAAPAGTVARLRLTLDLAPEQTARALIGRVQELQSSGVTATGSENAPAPVTISFVGLPSALAASSLSESDTEDADALRIESELNFLLIASHTGALTLTCEYDQDIYEPATVAGMLTSWCEVASQLPLSGEVPSGKLSLWARPAMSRECGTPSRRA